MMDSSATIKIPINMMNIKSISRFLIVLCFNVGALAVSPASLAAPQPKHPILLISLDGFRYDYLDKYPAPNLNKLAHNGVRAVKMRPSYPSVTFPNHITLVTGQYPEHHGIIHNDFYSAALNDVYHMGKAATNPAWLQAKPIWTLAEMHGLITATYYWPESDAQIGGILPHYYYHYNKSTPYQKRVDQVIDWFKMPKDKRPVFVSLYFSLVDTEGHHYGPNSQQVEKAVKTVDSYVGQLKRRIDSEVPYPVDIIVVSDHGMQPIDPAKRILIGTLPNLRNFKVINGGTQLMLYATTPVQKAMISSLAKQLREASNGRYTTYTKGHFPERLHYNDNARIADIVLEPIPPAFFPYHNQNLALSGGDHGYNPFTVPNMGAIFIANGPDFKRGLVIKEFENINVFPAMMHILDLPLPKRTDGKLSVLAPAMTD